MMNLHAHNQVLPELEESSFLAGVFLAGVTLAGVALAGVTFTAGFFTSSSSELESGRTQVCQKYPHMGSQGNIADWNHDNYLSSQSWTPVSLQQVWVRRVWREWPFLPVQV